MSTYKSQLELYKRQVQELQLKSSDETKRADKAEFEAKSQADNMQTVNREKEVTDSNCLCYEKNKYVYL